MFAIRRTVASGIFRTSRQFSTVPEKSAPVPVRGGSSFFQRLSAFLAGCGVGFGVSFYFVYNELAEANVMLARSIKQIENNVSKK
ncbi:hypothetical protein B484DRAFT_458347 [Ochromonadaceae sp. CCMP2298]|nr:hypothetical protein B484DRAFT_458347 [Ochromonadaceae sp. CCMP2298]